MGFVAPGMSWPFSWIRFWLHMVGPVFCPKIYGMIDV